MPSMKLIRMVSKDVWKVAESIGDQRIKRLLNPQEPKDLLDQLRREAKDTIQEISSSLRWQESDECPGYFRLVAQVPLTEATFDMFFNGRSGYRAQYYLSPEEGILFNHATLDVLSPALKAAYEVCPLEVEIDLIERSLRAPHAKIWVFDERAAFDDACELGLNPPRWEEGGRSRGRKAPLPEHRKLDVKGSFIRPQTDQLFIDECKIDRAWDLFNHGYT